MKIKYIAAVLFAAFAFKTGLAQDTAAVKAPVSVKLKAFKDVITSKAETKSGLLKIHKVDEHYYFEIPDDLLSREFLFTTRLVKVPTGSPRFGGELMNAIIVKFEKAPNNKLFVRAVTNVAQSDSTNVLSRAVRNANLDPIIFVLDLKARGADNKSSVVDMGDFFMKDNIISGFSADAKKVMRVSAPAADRSMLLSMNDYPKNIEVRSMKTYAMGGGGAAAVDSTGRGGEAGGENQGATAGSVTFEISNSVMIMPERPMQAQAADPRVGFYSDAYQVFSDAQQRVKDKSFITRTRLEVKPEDMAAYKAGKLVEPKEPLIYYVDPATPKQWRPYIIAGINDWNEAFKAAGFKNAIIGKEWPDNASVTDMEDVRYRVIRYFPSTSPASASPRVTDPRTGEILQTYIGWSHSRIKDLHDWYLIQEGAVDPGARSMKFDDALMGALIRADISKLVGSTLGLRENLSSSSTIPVEKLRDKKWLESHPFDNSIMDFNFFNYVAQPADQISRKGLIPRISDYDKWAIKWGYTNTGTTDFEKDKAIRLKWITDNVKPGSSLWYADSRIKNPSDPIDPRVQWADLGNDPIKASEYGINNLKIVMQNLNTWANTNTDDRSYYNVSDLYFTLEGQFSFLLRHVYSTIGGVNEDIKSVGDNGNVYAPEPKATQKAAVAFLNKEVFNTPTWIFNPAVLNKFATPAKMDNFQKFQETVLNYLLWQPRFYRMNTMAMRFDKDQVYSVDEMLTDLNMGLWAEVRNHQPVDSYKRMLQKSEIATLIRIMEGAEKQSNSDTDLSGSDVPVVLRSQLRDIVKQCKAAIAAYTDPLMVAHLQYVYEKIDNTLNPKK